VCGFVSSGPTVGVLVAVAIGVPTPVCAEAGVRSKKRLNPKMRMEHKMMKEAMKISLKFFDMVGLLT
jgi:hypothetical protein